MAMELQRPRDIRIRAARRSGRSTRPQMTVASALDVAVRGLLAGVGIGILLVAHAGFASIPVLGVLALGAALLSWDP
jgi:hypothetical protein